MKKLFFLSLFFIITETVFAQSFSPEIVSLSNFVRRMYEASPFEGVKVIEDYNNTYLISVVMIDRDKYSSETVMNKVAMAKALSNVGKFLNGSEISTNFIVQTKERKADTILTEIITYDILREKSVGMVDAMETLVAFNTSDNKYYIFVMYKEYFD